MTWIFAVAAAAAMGAAGYWIGRHHQEDRAVYPPMPEIREELERRIGEALDKARETRDAIVLRAGPDFPELPDSPLAEDQVGEVRGKVNAAAGIASLMEMPPSPRKPDLPFEKHVLTVGPGRRFLEWLNSQGCVAGARLPVASAEGETAYGMLTSNPGQVRVDYELKVLDAGGGIRLVPCVAYLEIRGAPELLPVESLPEVQELLLDEPE